MSTDRRNLLITIMATSISIGVPTSSALAGPTSYFDGTNWSSRIVAGLGGYTLAAIDDFNDRGDFVGLAANGNGFEFGFVAAAVPEPTSLALLGTGLVAVGVYTMRQGRRPSRQQGS